MNTLKEQLMRIAPQVKANHNQKLKTEQGYVSLNPNGFGFFKPKEGNSIFIPAKMTKGLLPFDVVEVTWDPSEERPRAQKVWIKERLPRKFAFTKTARGFVPCSQWNVDFRFNITVEDSESIQLNDVVMFGFDGIQKTPTIKVDYIEVIGSLLNFKNRHTAHLIDNIHPTEDCSLINFSCTEEVSDLTHLPFLTVDGNSTKDFDDAVYVEKTTAGWSVSVAVADVSAVVAKGSDLDILAKQKGSSVYLPTDVRPMLPREISESACSLLENQVRRALVVTLLYNAEGALLEKPLFQEAQIKVARRCTYEEVENWLIGEFVFDAPFDLIFKEWRSWQETLEVKEEAVFPWRRSEHYIHISDAGIVSCIEPKQTPHASKMVEVAMVAANRAAARLLFDVYGFAAFRNHAEPNWEQGPSALEKEGWLNTLPPKENAKQWWINAFKEYDGKEEAWVLARAWSKIQTPAQYQVKNDGHHALDSDAYTHFTSPIRRYADLEVHRAIKKALRNENYEASDWEAVVDYCNKAMRRAKNIERDVKSYWMGIWWSQQDVNLTASARVKAVRKDGSAFVTTDLFGSEGLVAAPENSFFKLGQLINVKFNQLVDRELHFSLAKN